MEAIVSWDPNNLKPISIKVIHYLFIYVFPKLCICIYMYVCVCNHTYIYGVLLANTSLLLGGKYIGIL